MSDRGRSRLLALAISLFVSAVLVVSAFNPAPHNGGDNAAYVTLAYSLAQHGTYTDLYDPAGLPHTKYPPVFPGLLAVLLLLGARTWTALKAVTALSTIAAVGFTFLWAERRLGPWPACAVALLLAISSAVVYYSHWILSDPLFVAFTMAALWALEGADEEGARWWWIVGGVAAAMVVALFATLSWVLSTEAQAAQGKILALHNPADRPIIQATGEVKRTEYEAEAPAQLDRIKGQLSEEIADGRLNVEIKGDYIAIRVGPVLRFKSGSADLSEDFSAMAKVIAAVLESEPGEIVVEGHSDNIPLRGTGRYKTNEALSEARAGTVRDLLVQTLSDPSRATIVGVGPNQPLDTDNTPEARAKNRRVEILLRQEQKQ